MKRDQNSLLLLASAALLTTMCTGTVAYGSGFGIFTQGASALGQADAVVAHSDEPSTIFFNPALLNKLPGTQVEVGTTLLFPSRISKVRQMVPPRQQKTLSIIPSLFMSAIPSMIKLVPDWVFSILLAWVRSGTVLGKENTLPPNRKSRLLMSTQWFHIE